jgi:hypothetical protein
MRSDEVWMRILLVPKIAIQNRSYLYFDFSFSCFEDVRFLFFLLNLHVFKIEVHIQDGRLSLIWAEMRRKTSFPLCAC